jgi:tetratricopeptide (TPR) repeat protein
MPAAPSACATRRPAPASGSALRRPAVSLIAALALLLAALLGGCERHSATAVSDTGVAPGAPTAPRLERIGRNDFALTTRSPQARAFFHQGLQLAYAFDHAEARRAFGEALRLDPDCAICAWGLAYVLGPNINRPERDRLQAAREHIARAQQLASQASEREQALIRALALRLGVDDGKPDAGVPAAGAMCVTPVPRDADPADVAYAQAMARVAFEHPGDADIGVLHAEALLMLSPWVWWQRDGTPAAGTREAIAELQRVLALDREHAGALHFLIHAWEQSPTPQQALDAAQRLPALVPDAGHLVHMPSHIHLRLGRYAQASETNRAAIAADAALAAQITAQGFAPQTHPSHHLHFLWASASLQGDGDAAVRAADEVAALAAQHDETYGDGNDYFIALPLFARVRFAQWDTIEAAAAQAQSRSASVYGEAIGQWARGMAAARQGRVAPAQAALAALREASAHPSLAGRSLKGIDELSQFVDLAAATLEGEVAVAQRRWPRAIAALERAVALEDALENDEPPPWALSSRVALAHAQLGAGRAADAERSLRADLARFPANGWALAALADSLDRQGRRQQAEAVIAQLDEVWGALPRAPLAVRSR